MKKKIISTLLLSLILLPMISLLYNVKAYNSNIKIDMNRDNIIFYTEMIVKNNTGKTSVKTSKDKVNYNLSYQYMFVPRDMVIKISNLSKDYDKKVKELANKEEDIIKKFEKIKNEFNEKVENGTSTEEERQKVEEEKNKSQTEISKIGEELKKMLEKSELELSKIVPQFDDSAWQTTTKTGDNIVINNIQDSEKSILVWVKATGDSETIYSFKIFDVDANKLKKDYTNESNSSNTNESNNINNNSNIKIEYISEMEIPKIKISGLKDLKHNLYRVYVSSEKKQVTSKDLNVLPPIKLENGDYIWHNDKLIELLEKGQDIYISIVALKEGTLNDIENIVINQYKMSKFPYDFKDYRAFSHSFIDKDSYQIVTNFVSTKQNSRKAKIKIGKITNKEILNKYRQNPISTTDELIEFAKKDSGIFNDVITEENNNVNNNILFRGKTSLFDGTNKLEDKEYYYIYLSTEDENGEYKHQEAITIAQAINIKDKTQWWSLSLYGDNKFKWLEGNFAKDNTTAKGRLPQTGVRYLSYISVIGIFATLGVTTYKIYRKNKF